MKKGNPKNIIDELKYPDVKPLLDTNKKVIVHLEPNRVGAIVGLFFLLVVLVIFLLIQLNGYTVALSSVLVVSAFTFVVTYGIAGILTYYGLWTIKTSLSPEKEESETEKVEEKTQE